MDLGASGVRLTDIAIDPCGGEAYAISETVLYFVDLTTGAATAIGPLEGRLAQNSLEASCDGPLYIWGFHDTKIFSVDPATLRTELVADTRHYGADLAISPNGTDLYGSTLDNRLIRTNLKTGATTVLGTFGTAERLPGLDFTPDGRLFATSGNDGKDAAAVYRIDLTSGEATLVGPVKRIGRLGNGGMTIRW